MVEPVSVRMVEPDTHTQWSLMKKAVQSVYFDYLEKKEEGKGGARAEMAV